MRVPCWYSSTLRKIVHQEVVSGYQGAYRDSGQNVQGPLAGTLARVDGDKLRRFYKKTGQCDIVLPTLGLNLTFKHGNELGPFRGGVVLNENFYCACVAVYMCVCLSVTCLCVCVYVSLCVHVGAICVCVWYV